MPVEMAEKRQGMGLKLELVRRGLPVSTVAARAGVSRHWLSRVLNGKAPLSDKLARDLAFALKIPKDRIWQLWRGEDA